MPRGFGHLFPADNFPAGPLPGPQPAALQILQSLARAMAGTPPTKEQIAAATPALTFQETQARAAQLQKEAEFIGNYRPQFVHPPTPPGSRDDDFVAYYDQINTPGLGTTLAAGADLRDVPLQLETDSRFIARAILVYSQATDLQFREPGGKLLSPVVAPLLHTVFGGGLLVFPFGALGVNHVPLEPEIECDPGSVFLAYFHNPFPVPLPINAVIAFYGVKRYAECN
jgi:hypothetical protein